MEFKEKIACLTLCSLLACLLTVNAQQDNIDGPEVTSHLPFVVAEDYANFRKCSLDDPEKRKACFNVVFQEHFTQNFKVPEDSLSQKFDGKVYFKFFVDPKGNIDSTIVFDRVGTKFIQEKIDQTLQKLPSFKAVKLKNTLVRTGYVLYAKFKPGEAIRFRVIDIVVNKEQKKEKRAKDDVAFAIIEDAPIYPGCENGPKINYRNCFNRSLQKHIRQNFRYPREMQILGVEGRVLIFFVVKKDGTIGNIRTRGPHPLLELEGRRIISKLPKIRPGLQKGKPVRVPFSIPLTFKLQ